MLTGCRIADRALSRQLVAFLAVFPTPLAVALPGDHHASGAFSAEIARGQAEVDQGEYVLNTLGLVLDSAGVKNHSACRSAVALRRLLNRLRRHTRDSGNS